MALKKVNRDPFGSGTECDIWSDNNCDKCVKGSRYKGDDEYGNPEYTKIRCSIQRDIFIRMWSKEPIAQRTIDACRKRICPYRQTERKHYEKYKNEPKLFEI